MDLMTVEEIASKLRVRRSWVYTHADELGAYRLGKYLRFSWSRVIESLERKTTSLVQPHYDPSRTFTIARDKIEQEQNKNESVE